MSDDQPARDDRRRFPRKRASWALTWRSPGGPTHQAEVVDVSEDGLAFRVSNGHAPGQNDVVDVVVAVREGVSLESPVRVANASGGRVGGQFVGLPLQDRLILRHYVRYSHQV